MNSTKTMELADLPDELLCRIFRFLPAKDMCKIISTCQRFNEIQKNDQLWKYYCLRDYGIGAQSVWSGWMFRDFYSKILYKYAYLLGWWRRNLESYGGLLLVKMENNAIAGYECHPPLDDCQIEFMRETENVHVLPDSDYSREAYHRLRFSKMFEIAPVGSGTSVVCYEGLPGHESRVHRGSNSQDESSTSVIQSNGHECASIHRAAYFGFEFSCQRFDEHQCKGTLYWIQLEHGISIPTFMRNSVLNLLSMDRSMLEPKFRAYAQARRKCDYSPLVVQRDISGSVTYPCIKPGLYFCDYDTQGWEILNFKYTPDGKFLDGTKVKGDPHVPAGTRNTRVYLTKPVHLTADDQATMTGINQAMCRAARQQSSAIHMDTSPKPFYTPPDTLHVQNSLLQRRSYRWSFLCEGIFLTDDSDPVPLLFIGFDEDNFALLWTRAYQYCAFYRCTNLDEM